MRSKSQQVRPYDATVSIIHASSSRNAIILLRCGIYSERQRDGMEHLIDQLDRARLSISRGINISQLRPRVGHDPPTFAQNSLVSYPSELLFR
jgi:hypothetical protein